MQVKPEELSSRLTGNLAPVYLVSGDETLLVEEACDAIIAAARVGGYTERSVHHVEGGFKWHDLSHDAASMSLFAERKILDVRVPVKKFDKQASESLREWADGAPDATDGDADTLLLLRTTRLEPRQRSSAWFKALDKVGLTCLIWPISPQQLPRWLQARSKQVGISISSEALQYLADRVEGNLLAAAQELEKLALLRLPQPIGLDEMIAASQDTSRFSSFDLMDAVMGQDPARSQRILEGLREEGVSLFAILGAFTAQLRRGGNTRGLPPGRVRAIQSFFQRIKDPAIVLAQCAVIDQQGKGQLAGDAWLSLSNLLIRLAGVRALPLPSEDQRLLRGG